MAKHPRLIRRNGVYYFRAKVPVDLVPHYAPKKEIVLSLRTRDPKQALELVRVESVKRDQEFSAARLRLAAVPSDTLRPAEIERLAALYYHHRLTEDEEQRRNPDLGGRILWSNVKKQLAPLGVESSFTEAQVNATFGMSEREYQKQLETVAWVLPNAKAALAKADIGYLEEEVDLFLEDCSVTLDKQSEAYRSVAFAILKAEVRALEAIHRRNAGDVVDTPLAPAWASTATIVDAAQGLSLSGLWKAYVQERKPPAKTESDFGAYVDRFIQVNGDLLRSVHHQGPCASVQRRHAAVSQAAQRRTEEAVGSRPDCAGGQRPDGRKAVGANRQ